MSDRDSLTTHRYFFYKDSDGLDAQKEYLRPGRGLERFIVQNKIEERRVTVDKVSEIQDLLDEGHQLVLYKMRTNYGDAWRFSRIIVMDSENTHVDGDDIVYKGVPKPASENNIFPNQIECIQQFLVIADPEYDQGLSQKERGKKLTPSEPEVVSRPVRLMEHPGYEPIGELISDEEAARRANELMEQIPARQGINPLLK